MQEQDIDESYPDLSSEDNFDPARRRWLFDPARRRSQRRKGGRQPAALRRYWAMRRGRKGKAHDPTHRRRSSGRRRGRSRRFGFDPARRHGRRRGRRYDIAFGPAGSWRDVISDYFLTAAGSIAHNFLVHKQGIGSQVHQLPMGINVTTTGGAAGLLGILGEKMGWLPSFLRPIFKGMFSEGFNYPLAEQITRSGNGAGQAQAGFPGAGIPSASAMAQGPLDYSYITQWGYT